MTAVLLREKEVLAQAAHWMAGVIQAEPGAWEARHFNDAHIAAKRLRELVDMLCVHHQELYDLIETEHTANEEAYREYLESGERTLG